MSILGRIEFIVPSRDTRSRQEKKMDIRRFSNSDGYQPSFTVDDSPCNYPPPTPTLCSATIRCATTLGNGVEDSIITAIDALAGDGEEDDEDVTC